jgi:hypothetical protein
MLYRRKAAEFAVGGLFGGNIRIEFRERGGGVGQIRRGQTRREGGIRLGGGDDELAVVSKHGNGEVGNVGAHNFIYRPPFLDCQKIVF